MISLMISLVTTLAGTPGDGLCVEPAGSWEFEVAAEKERQKEEQMRQKAEDGEERRVNKDQRSDLTGTIFFSNVWILLYSIK